MRIFCCPFTLKSRESVVDWFNWNNTFFLSLIAFIYFIKSKNLIFISSVFSQYIVQFLEINISIFLYLQGMTLEILYNTSTIIFCQDWLSRIIFAIIWCDRIRNLLDMTKFHNNSSLALKVFICTIGYIGMISYKLVNSDEKNVVAVLEFYIKIPRSLREVFQYLLYH